MTQPLLLVLKPFVRGEITRGRAILRLTTYPAYVSVSAAELAVLDEMTGLSVSLESFVRWHLSGQAGLTFREAMQLLVKLHDAGFLDETASQGIRARLEALSQHSRHVLHIGVRKVWQYLSRRLDITVIEFSAPTSNVHWVFRKLGTWLISVPALLVLTASTSAMFWAFPALNELGDIAFRGLWHRPEAILIAMGATIAIAFLIVAILQMITLSGTKAEFLSGSFRLTGLSIFRLAWHDDESLILPRGQMIRYFCFQLIIPWFLGAALWHAGGRNAKILALAFFVRGLAQMSPLYRGPLVKLAEGRLAMLNILDLARHYLDRHLIKGQIFSRNPSIEKMLTAFACLTMLWLYCISLLFADALVSALPVSLAILAGEDAFIKKTASMLILSLLSLGVVMTATRLLMVFCDNIASIAQLPLRKARRSLESFTHQSVEPTEAVMSFLREIAIFSHLSEIQLMQMTQKLTERTLRRGQTILQQGESGDEFGILATGEAQVTLEDPDGTESLLGILRPGDSFGEVALIENSPRTATVRATKPSTMFALAKRDFDALFPEGTDERRYLSYIIRRVKLVMESQAVSHLSPTEIRELLRCSDRVEFKAGEAIVKSGDFGDAVYLIESGHAKVVLAGEHLPVSILHRGDLIGVIAVVKDVKRTADVTAESDVSCLKIDRGIFIGICMSNVSVAMLVSDMSDRHLSDRDAA